MGKIIRMVFCFVVVLIGACASSPSTYEYSVSSTAERTANVQYTVTDQQAYSIAKAWVTSMGNAQLRSDDSEGGALSAIGSNRNWNWSCTIFVANRVARITFSCTYRDNIWAVSRVGAENQAASVANEWADDRITSFQSSYR